MIGSKDFTTPIEFQKQQKKLKLRKSYLVLGVVIILVMIIGITQTQNKEIPMISAYQFTSKLVKDVTGYNKSLGSGH